uniref:ATP synthase subunit a n=1 Tax=Gomphocerus sibiricus tibetanus TaxID=369698 RepID=F4YUH9_9ORTH|nr:ATP synthase F0 subunit 6 [Gomphocerus sibiricus tibetanus]ADG85454.1 ATP synthase F0 subunit 6 [Gomphocerus sibiricus tibetanus]
MMTNFFSTFDPPTNIFYISMNWTTTFFGLLLIPPMFWLTSSPINIMWKKKNFSPHNEFKTLLGPKSFIGATFFFISTFIMMLFNNFMGLFPHIFSSTSHLTLTFTIAVPMWLSLMLFGGINHTNHMFAHLVPQGTPPPLMSFMVLIETISNIIRPGTLSVRLSANMIAGHLLLTLLGNTGATMSTNLISMLIIGQMMLLILESAVAMIQAYVFSILSTLYSSEVY